MKNPLLALCLFAGLTAFMTGCPSNGDDSGSPALDPKALVSADIAAMQNVDVQNLRSYDNNQNGLFSRIFGGTDGPALHEYLFTRLSHFYSVDDLKLLKSQPDDFRYKGWRTELQKQASLLADTQVKIGAANIGTQFWLSGLIDGVPVTVYDGDEAIPVNSSRVGLMLIGPGYRTTESDADGNSIDVPIEARQAILIHEARHSDCTGGITQSDVEILRNSSSSREANMRFTNRACGHLHTFCRVGSKFEGILACDDRPWGAYAIQYIYLRATTNLYDRHSIARAYMEFSAADAYSRLLTSDTLSGRPDMTSEGLR